jgi:16S rRNA (cytosine1402-N4)-methyltransferase
LDLIVRLSQDELADVIYHFGEERRSRRVARCIKLALEAGELHTTVDLRRAVVRAVGPQRGRGIDPATLTFQALRIAVNRELDELNLLLAVLPDILVPGGVAALMSFHSLEDRRVKQAFKDRSVWRPLTKKPLQATAQEQEANPRSRSAKLRVAQRLSSTGLRALSRLLPEELPPGTVPQGILPPGKGH